MTIERLDEDVRLPFDEPALLSEDPQLLRDYIQQLVKTLQDIIERFTQVANLGLDLNDSNVRYFGARSSDGSYPDGTWRIIKVDENDFQLQKKISGDWVKNAKWSE